MQSKNSEISQAVQEIIRQNRADKDPTYETPQFNTTNIYPIFKHLFNQKAIKSLENYSPDMIYQYNRLIVTPGFAKLVAKLNIKGTENWFSNDADYAGVWIREFDRVCFVASRSEVSGIATAVEKVATTVNKVADLNFTKASLVPLMLIELNNLDTKSVEYAVVSYITLTRKGEEYVKLHMPNMFIQECGLPLRVEEQ